MTFRDQLATDMDLVFANVNEYGENVTWDPDGANIAVNAVINREQLDTFGQDRDRSLQKRATVWISKSDVATITEGSDEMEFSEVEGVGPAVRWTVQEIINRDDPGAWKLLAIR